MKEGLEQKKEIRKIHFLVHPGYGAKYGHGLTNPESYIDKATSLSEDELMVVFAPSIGEKFIKDVREGEQEYVNVIKKIKEKLGNRSIILADDDLDDRSAIFPVNREWIWNKIKNIASKRGFVFGKELNGDVYGEYLDSCVQWVALNMRRTREINNIKIDRDIGI